MKPEQTTFVSPTQQPQAIILWLAGIAILVFLLVIVGGVTRLTHSGLSMVEWRPLLGALPPMSDSAWLETFEKYQQFPEYQQLKTGMTMTEFKTIFFWEYMHRLLGRVVGLAFIFPWIFFALKKKIPRGLNPTLLGLFALGGLQGLMGWYMVQSGLADNPFVSHYRLAAHLSLAFALIAALTWVTLNLQSESRPTKTPEASKRATTALRLYRQIARALLALIALQIVYGAFTAGLKAGFSINTFPTMNGEWIPTNILVLDPFWRNLTENNITVQFIHRTLAWIMGLCILCFWALAKSELMTKSQRSGLGLLASLVVLQFTLGVFTLILVVPLILAVAHQVGAGALLVASVYLLHSFRVQKVRPPLC